jgi:dienelactone hydrolase
LDFGWHGDDDLAASVDELTRRDDVDPSRIAVVGLSMGGEEAIGATAEDDRIRAVVAEGATARSAGDEEWLSDRYGLRGALQETLEELQDVVTDALTDASVPTSNRSAISRSAATYLLIAAGEVPEERHAAADLQAVAPDRVEVWVVPGAGHTDGLTTAPQEWERRVVAFLDGALGVPSDV